MSDDFRRAVTERTTQDISELTGREIEPLIIRYGWTPEETMDVLKAVVKVISEAMRSTHEMTKDIISDVFAERGER